MSSTALLKHPGVVFFNECAQLTPLPPLTSGIVWDEVLALDRPPPEDDSGLERAILDKARVVRELQTRQPITFSLDAGWLDFTSSHVLLVERVISPYWESRLMQIRFQDVLRTRVLAFAREALDVDESLTVSVLHPHVVQLAGQRRVVPVGGRVALDAQSLVTILSGVWIKDRCHGTITHSLQAAVQQARKILADV